MSIETIIQHEARLAILKELNNQPNKALSSEAVRRVLLATLLIDKPREWVEIQFAFLRDVGVINIHQAASVQIAQLAERGGHYLAGMVQIAGIQPPTIGL